MELFATRYITRFSCIGAQCEDNCCHSWGVAIDKQHYELLRDKMTTPDEQAEFRRSLRIVDENDDKGLNYSLMVLQDGGNCSMLDTDKLCKIHKRYGEEVLSNTCAIYPKIAGRIGDRFELLGTPSCPEMARLILLGEDAMDFVPGDRAAFPRGLILREVDKDAPDNYRRSFYPVRGLMLGLLRVTQFPIAARLFFLAFFADRTRASLRERPESFDGDQLFKLMHSLREFAILESLAEQWEQIVVPVPFGLSVVRELLTLPSKKIPAPLTKLIAEVRPTYEARGVTLDSELEDFFTAFEEQRPTLSARVAARLEQYVTRYAQQYVAREWFIMQPSLMQYVMGLLARVAVLRFLLLSHPELHALAAREDDAAITQLDAFAVRVVYALSRMLEHDEPLARQLIAELEEQDMTRLEHAVCLSKI